MEPKSCIGFGGGWNRTLAACLILLPCGCLHAQELIAPAQGLVRLMPSDATILEAPENRKDLPCTVNPDKPALGFDLKFHINYEVTVPIKELVGAGNQLTIVFRVTPDGQRDGTYFSQHYSVPQIDNDEGGPAYLNGTFNVGEGKYHVDWLMRDRAERMCSFHWDADATLPPRDKQMSLDVAAGAVQPLDTEIFRQEPPIQRQPKPAPLNVKVMVNFAPQDANGSALQPLDTRALLSMLRSIAREPRISKFSVVAYNMQQQKVIFRESEASQIDFPALGQAVQALRLGTVDLKQLVQKHSDTDFLTQLITNEIKDPKDEVDALIFAGPKIMLDDAVSAETLKQLSDVKYPVFYMNYNANPQLNPWRDAIGNAVRVLKGAEYTISRPRDLYFAWSEIIGRIVKSKVGRAATAEATLH
ncbi:MAG TPA: acetyltransferase [Bryobacteraceae bacterium]|jgi:hypothetical protein|nr:acetyltransferase [Bryobacteraceae bacterium]